MSDVPSRLYLVTPTHFDPQEFAATLDTVMTDVEVACVRLDLSSENEEEWVRCVNHLLPVCHARDVPLIVRDHFRLVAPLGLDGVHLASPRLTVREAREALGKDRIVGAAAGASRHQGMVIAEAGADYVSFGPVGDTGALGADERAGDDLFQWWAEMIETPCVAEGGVSLEDAIRLNDFTDFVVPAASVWQGETPVAALADFAAALSEPE